MGGIIGALLGSVSAMLNAALTVGTPDSITFGFFTGVYGTLSPATYTDHGSNSRTIAVWNWNNIVGGTVGFRLSGTSIANTDTTFVSIALGGRVLLRSAATYTANDGGGRTLWNWSVDTSGYPISGTVQALVQ